VEPVPDPLVLRKSVTNVTKKIIIMYIQEFVPTCTAVRTNGYDISRHCKKLH
jgi:hypothetical protein